MPRFISLRHLQLCHRNCVPNRDTNHDIGFDHNPHWYIDHHNCYLVPYSYRSGSDLQ